MKFLSVFLVASMLFLSFVGTVKPVTTPSQKSCCHRMKGTAGKPACNDQKPGSQKDGCGKLGCTMMLSCSICGFFGVETLQLQPNPSNYIPKPTPLYKIGDLSSYYPSDWKPPKSC